MCIYVRITAKQEKVGEIKMDRENLIEALEYCKKHGALGGNDCNGHYEYTDNLQNIIKVNN